MIKRLEKVRQSEPDSAANQGAHSKRYQKFGLKGYAHMAPELSLLIGVFVAFGVPAFWFSHHNAPNR